MGRRLHLPAKRFALLAVLGPLGLWAFALFAVASPQARAQGAAPELAPPAVRSAPPAATAASPDDTPLSMAEVRRLVQRGNSEYALGHFKAAMELFENAYRVKPIAGLLYNIAQCHRQLKQFDEAATTYRSFIRLDPQSRNVSNAKDLLAEVEAVLRAQQKAQTAPPLDNDLRPPERSRRKSDSTVVAAAPANPSSTDLQPGLQPAPVVADLQPPGSSLPAIAPARPPGLPTLQTGPSTMPSTGLANGLSSTSGKPPAPVPAVIATPSPPPQRRRLYTWIAGGAGVAALGAGGIIGLSAKSAENDLTSSDHTKAQITDLQNEQKSRAGAANVLFIAGAGLLVIGGVLYFLHL